MKKYFNLLLCVFIISSGHLFPQSNLKIETTSRLKGRNHRVVKNQTNTRSIDKGELINIGKKLGDLSDYNRALKREKKQAHNYEERIVRKPIKINNTRIKSKFNYSETLKSFDPKSAHELERLNNEVVMRKSNNGYYEDGEEWIAAMDYVGDNRSLFLTKPIINDFDLDIKELSTSQILESGTPITVFSNGSAIIFVDTAFNIKSINTDGSEEQIISTSSDWYSVSISPDGSKLAAISDIIEPYIHLIDLVNPDSSKTFRIYNPLSSQGENDTTLQYADALTWASNGNQIYYDCLIDEFNGNEYWTINLLNLSDGNNIQLFEIEAPFEVWGPAASHKGKYLLLDLHDTATDSVTILLVDFNEDLPGLIEENGLSISNSKFSPLDDMVVYEYFDSLNGSIVPILSKIELSEDKRIPASYSEQFVDSFRYPVWFVIGGVPVSVENEESKTISNQFVLNQNYPNPFNPTTVIEYTLPKISTNIGSPIQLKVYDILGREIEVIVNQYQQPGNYKIEFNASGLGSGIYFYNLSTNNFSESKKMLFIK